MDNPDCGFKAMRDGQTTAGSILNHPAYHQIVLFPAMVLLSDILGDQKLVVMKRRYLHLMQASILLESFPVKQMKATGSFIYLFVTICGL